MKLPQYQLVNTSLKFQDSNYEIALHLHNAKTASLNGVHRVHLLPYAYDGALIEELFTRDGHGTMITDTVMKMCVWQMW